jgi:hypothetical protein
LHLKRAFTLKKYHHVHVFFYIKLIKKGDLFEKAIVLVLVVKKKKKIELVVCNGQHVGRTHNLKPIPPPVLATT